MLKKETGSGGRGTTLMISTFSCVYMHSFLHRRSKRRIVWEKSIHMFKIDRDREEEKTTTKLL